MAIRNIYLKIEIISNYNPVAPWEKAPPPIQYKRDCMQNKGHTDGKIPESEVQARALDAVVYREYLDKNYLIPKPDKLVQEDINEPIFSRRVPGTVIYAKPGDELHIHVKNATKEPYSFHLHGLEYDISSDGAWPFGTQTTDGRRSDEICPGQRWTYIFKIKGNMIGLWPFHDHAQKAIKAIERGLFGGIVVLPRKTFPVLEPIFLPPEIKGLVEKVQKPKFNPNVDVLAPDNAFDGFLGKTKEGDEVFQEVNVAEQNKVFIKDQVEFMKEFVGMEIVKIPELIVPIPVPIPRRKTIIHVPLFFHVMQNPNPKPKFDSGDIEEKGQPGNTWTHTFNDLGDLGYFCSFHPQMKGTVKVVAGGPATASVNIVEVPQMGFSPQVVTVGPGGQVTWTNQGQQHHTVTSSEGGALKSHCFNGRSFIGNSPTIEGYPGQKIHWYVFNLDIGHEWHNFHPHASRWRFANENIDIRSLGPAESFVVKTEVPDVIDLPPKIKRIQNPKLRPKSAKLWHLKGEFIFHCHVHHHLMNGMVGMVRSKESVWLTDAMKKQLEATRGLIINDFKNSCPEVDKNRCKKHGEGKWELVKGAPEVTFMHSMLLPKTNKVLYWGYTRADQSRLWDYTTAVGAFSTPPNQPVDEFGGDINTSNMWSAQHAHIDDANGTILIHGGFSPNQALLFDPPTLKWTKTDATAHNRFYSTTLKLNDERLITFYGSGSKSHEIYKPSAAAGSKWDAPVTLPWNEHQYYPWTFLLPNKTDHFFIAGPHVPTRVFDLNNLANNMTYNTIQGDRSGGGEKGTACMLTLRPIKNYEPRIVIMGGQIGAIFYKTTEIINLADTAPAWKSMSDMSEERGSLTSALLPDGRIFVAGGIKSPVGDGGPCELYDPKNPALGWQKGPVMKYHRAYHSSLILLADGSILMGGDPSRIGPDPSPHERYFPGYYFKTRPVISGSPASVKYGATFTITSPQASLISEVILMAPGAVTHGWNMMQRAVECTINKTIGNNITAQAPPDGYVAPSGWYLLFILDANRVPSVAKWIRVIK